MSTSDDTGGAPDTPDPNDPLNEYDQELPDPEAKPPNPDHAWKALSNINDWIKHAESKTGIVLAAAGASGVLLYNLVKDQTDPGFWLSTAALLAGVFLVLTGLAGVFAILPRLTLNPKRLPFFKKAEPDLSSLLFFSHVAKKYKGEDGNPSFVEVFRTLTSDDDHLTQQIAQQVHANATVAHRKYRAANIAIVTLALDYASLAVVAAIIGSN